ncbi:unnamed protein product [Lepeophtheirus salmonis]|uniref:(salmon louse) hypothetical protein n=1 Tax=Lepeophtheirus salmonis TaxID=72036 RepID=A0A7R8CCA7_LEPSM|nr:unnamed protein product [Lepeophtheirus salmonis]CAF2769274.1 unnamed protein product [Lepeophtheirus salmonis]
MLIHHKAVHLRIKAYTCDICGKSYSRVDSLKDHVASTHSLDVPSFCANTVERHLKDVQLALDMRDFIVMTDVINALSVQRNFLLVKHYVITKEHTLEKSPTSAMNVVVALQCNIN